MSFVSVCRSSPKLRCLAKVPKTPLNLQDVPEIIARTGFLTREGIRAAPDHKLELEIRENDTDDRNNP